MKPLKSYVVEARIPMTTEARNAGAKGRRFWWSLVGKVNARSKRQACVRIRQQNQVPACADKLRAFPA